MIASVTFDFVYDNNPSSMGLRSDWGLSVLIRGLKETILFDFGANESILAANMRAMGIKREAIQILVLSHMHQDHYGGMEAALVKGQRSYLPGSATETLLRRIQSLGVSAEKCRTSVQVERYVHTTGTFPGAIPEQGLVIDTPGGRVLLTGCAHPGIETMTRTLADAGLCPDVILGGFHLKNTDEQNIRRIAQSLKSMGVKQAGPCHCSGEPARKIFAEIFAQGYLDVRVGSKVVMKKN